MTAPTIDPGVADAVTAMGESYMPVLAGPPDPGVTGEAWWRYADASSATTLAEQLATMPADYDGLRSVATAFLCSRLMSPLALLGGRPVVVHGRGVVLDADALWLRRHPRGWHDGIALAAPRLVVTADDPLAGRDGTMLVDDADAVRSAAVASVMAVAEPVVARLRATGRLGERAMWGQLADMLVTAAARPHDATGDADTARHEAEALLACDDRLWVSPTVARVEVAGGVGLAWRRGSCCLAYQVERYELCTGCPLLDEGTWWQRSVESVRRRAGGDS